MVSLQKATSPTPVCLPSLVHHCASFHTSDELTFVVYVIAHFLTLPPECGLHPHIICCSSRLSSLIHAN